MSIPLPRSAKTALLLAMGISAGLLQACGGKSLSLEAAPLELAAVEGSGSQEPAAEHPEAEPAALLPPPNPESLFPPEDESLPASLGQELFEHAEAPVTTEVSPFTAEDPLQAGEDPTLLAMEVPDSGLAEMRGRFVSNNGNDLLYFGVEMTTQWQTGAGELAIAGVSLAANMPQGQLNAANVQIRPHLTLVRTADPPPETPVQDGPIRTATLGGNGFATATGVVQAIQVAGDTNQVVNDLYINIQKQPGGTGPGTANGGPLLTKTGTQELVSDSGTKASVQAGNNRLGVTVSVPDQGEVIQQIRGGQAGAILQQARVFSDVNVVHNVITLYAQMAPLSQIQSAINTNLEAAIYSLRGLPPP